MDNNNANKLIIDFFLTVPFPFKNILKRQFESSVITVDDSHYNNGYYYLRFQIDDVVEKFPLYLDTVPLSFQITDFGAPITFLLFVNNGMINEIEIANSEFRSIEWEKLSANQIVLDFNFDERAIINNIRNCGNRINKVQTFYSAIDVALDIGVISFRGCSFKGNFSIQSFFTNFQLIIEEICDDKYRYHVYLKGKSIVDFKCISFYQQYHKLI